MVTYATKHETVVVVVVDVRPPEPVLDERVSEPKRSRRKLVGDSTVHRRIVT